jgi:hypothetical protein
MVISQFAPAFAEAATRRQVEAFPNGLPMSLLSDFPATFQLTLAGPPSPFPASPQKIFLDNSFISDKNISPFYGDSSQIELKQLREELARCRRLGFA